jgi:aflatoxin B1 aldehyde reductase
VQVDIFYIHAPDSSVPLSETLAGVNEVYKKGLFTRFGLSNYQAADVEAVYAHCREHNYVLPSVYQGNYSAVARKQDTLLFPTLRKLKIAFYAYSPLAGGFLTKSKQQIADGAGRFGDALGGMYKDMYAKPAYLEALAEWEAIAQDVGCSKADLAYRWVTYNSPLKPEYGDGIIVGASTLKQLEQTMEGLKAGPLSAEAVKRIDHVWKTVEHEAPLDNYHR